MDWGAGDAGAGARDRDGRGHDPARQGTQTVQALRGQTVSRQSLRKVADSGLTGIGAILLILPGFLTDLIGLALMVPPLRRLIVRLVGARVQVVQTGMPQQDDVVEGTAVEVEASRNCLRDGPSRDRLLGKGVRIQREAMMAEESNENGAAAPAAAAAPVVKMQVLAQFVRDM